MTGNNSTDPNGTTTQTPALFFDSAFELYSQYAVIAIGIIGIAANGLILYALIVHNARETKKAWSIGLLLTKIYLISAAALLSSSVSLRECVIST